MLRLVWTTLVCFYIFGSRGSSKLLTSKPETDIISDTIDPNAFSFILLLFVSYSSTTALSRPWLILNSTRLSNQVVCPYSHNVFQIIKYALSFPSSCQWHCGLHWTHRSSIIHPPITKCFDKLHVLIKLNSLLYSMSRRSRIPTHLSLINNNYLFF